MTAPISARTETRNEVYISRPMGNPGIWKLSGHRKFATCTLGVCSTSSNSLMTRVERQRLVRWRELRFLEIVSSPELLCRVPGSRSAPQTSCD